MATQTPVKGKQTNMFWGLEEAYGVPPDDEAGAWLRVPYYSSTLKPDEPREPDPILGRARHNDRDPTASAPGLITHGGDVALPLDLGVLPFLLFAAFGSPQTSGTDPNLTHAFTSATAELPTFSAVMALGSGSPLYFVHHGLALSRLTLNMRREAGLRRAQTTWLGQKTTRPGAAPHPSGLADPSAEQFAAAIGIVRIDGTPAGSLIEGSLQYDTGATPKEYVTGTPEISGIELGNDAAATGQIAVRFDTAALYDKALAHTAIALELEWAINANRSLKLALPLAHLAQTAPEVDGPGGIEARFDFTAAQTNAAPMITATLKTGAEAFPPPEEP